MCINLDDMFNFISYITSELELKLYAKCKTKHKVFANTTPTFQVLSSCMPITHKPFSKQYIICIMRIKEVRNKK